MNRYTTTVGEVATEFETTDNDLMRWYVSRREPIDGEDGASTSVDDCWIKHNGGPRPVRGDVKVSVKFRRGESADHSRCAGYWCWGHNNDEYDIIAYRIVDE